MHQVDAYLEELRNQAIFFLYIVDEGTGIHNALGFQGIMKPLFRK